jgi:hypothetical protein
LKRTKQWLACTTIVFLFLPAREEPIFQVTPTPAATPAPAEPEVAESLYTRGEQEVRAEPAAPVPAKAEVVESLYTPTEAEVRAEYQRDLANQKLQTWREYWGWVQSFYKGNLMAAGWTKYSETTLEEVKADDARPQLLKKINRLGKLIGQEWAKHDRVRKINTTDLKRWNDAITDARRKDDGTGQGILSTIDRICVQAERQLKG